MDGNRLASWQAACQTLLLAWEPTILTLARRYAPEYSAGPDFAQVARLALIRAAWKFQDGSGHLFEHYARRTMRNALIDEAKRARNQRFVPEVTARDNYHSECGLEHLIREESRGLVRQRVGRWVLRLQALVNLLFWEDLTQAEAARRMGLTSARINQLFKEIQHDGLREFHDLADFVQGKKKKGKGKRNGCSEKAGE